MSELELTISRLIQAPPEAVYHAWLNPELLPQFMIPAEGVTLSQTEVDAREGGRFFMMMNTPDEIPHSGEYLELKPFTKIVFTWESPYSVDGSVVTLQFSEEEGGTRVNLHHHKFLNEEARNNHQHGWTSILENLDNKLATALA